jgi:hypothetical protein
MYTYLYVYIYIYVYIYMYMRVCITLHVLVRYIGIVRDQYLKLFYIKLYGTHNSAAVVCFSDDRY